MENLPSRLKCILSLTVWAGLVVPEFSIADRPVPHADEARMREVVEHLAADDYAGRAGEDAIRAGRWVAEQFKDIGLELLFTDGYVQVIPDKDGKTIGTNIAGILPGTDENLSDQYVFVTGHHDHLGTRNGAIYHGANDNASAVAMVLEAARYFAANPAKRTMVFVSFDLEENMLWGSRYFVANPVIDLQQIHLFMTADMIGRPLGGLPFKEVFVMGGETAQPLGEIIAAQSQRTEQPVMRLGADVVGTRSDYGPFRDEKVPFLFFSTGENPDYHTPRDTPDRMDFALATRIANLMIATADAAANETDQFVWTGKPPQDISDAYTMQKVCETVMAAADAGQLKLGVVEKLLVTQTLDRTKAIIARGKFESGDRKWLVRAAQGMLLTLF